MMKKATQEEAVAVTSVFWDMNMCPVPPGCDLRLVPSCIKLFLENFGYSGPVSITAVGVLTDVPIDILRGVYSSGIAIAFVSYGSSETQDLINIFTEANPPPANIMVIADPKFFPSVSCKLQTMGYNFLQPFPYHSLQSIFRAALVSTYPGIFDEDYPFWYCLTCPLEFPGQRFENFIKHLSSERHQQLFLNVLHRNAKARRRPPLVSFIPHSENATTMVATPSGNSKIDYEAVALKAKTLVLWDINTCPVPVAFDAGLARPCIEKFLKMEGYSGPLTIIAVSVLTDVPIDILSVLYASGIALNNVPYGSPDIPQLICDFVKNPPPANIMVISNSNILDDISSLIPSGGYRLLQPFPYRDLRLFYLTYSASFRKVKCSEIGESACWVCSVCCGDLPSRDFENFTTHISSRPHQGRVSELLTMNNQFQHKPREVKGWDDETWVFWDINMCPVPPPCDPRWVGPCIKRFLKNCGYSGPVTITAVGVLTDVPNDILRGVYSSGIALNSRPRILTGTADLIRHYARRNRPPANIMVISHPMMSVHSTWLEMRGYNLLQPFVYDSLQRFLLAYSGELKEIKCSEKDESPYWDCAVCGPKVAGQGFEKFTKHLSSSEHQRELLGYFPPSEATKAKVQETVDVNKKKKKKKMPHGFNGSVVISP